MNLSDLLDTMAHDPDCVILSAAGQPTVQPSCLVADDARAFYEQCGGVIIAHGSPYVVRLVQPDRCVSANEYVLESLVAVARELQDSDRSWYWYIMAHVENGNTLSIDFGPTNNGRCYDSFWETYGLVGQMPVIATSFSSLIEQLYGSKGKYWYWLEPGFQAPGDAYDAP